MQLGCWGTDTAPDPTVTSPQTWVRACWLWGWPGQGRARQPRPHSGSETPLWLGCGQWAPDPRSPLMGGQPPNAPPPHSPLHLLSAPAGLCQPHFPCDWWVLPPRSHVPCLSAQDHPSRHPCTFLWLSSPALPEAFRGPLPGDVESSWWSRLITASRGQHWAGLLLLHHLCPRPEGRSGRGESPEVDPAPGLQAGHPTSARPPAGWPTGPCRPSSSQCRAFLPRGCPHPGTGSSPYPPPPGP